MSPKQKFWTRLSAHFAVGTVAPITAILLQKHNGMFVAQLLFQESGTSISLWFIIIAMIFGITSTSYLRWWLKSLTGYSLTKQVVQGIKSTVLPIIVAALIVGAVSNFFVMIERILWILAITQSAAIPINPMPKYVWEKEDKEQYDGIIIQGVEYISKRNKKD